MTIPLPMRFDDEPLLWTVDDVYTAEECRQFIAYVEDSAPTLATNNPGFRDQDRVMKDDPEAADDLFRRLRPQLPESIGAYKLAGINTRFRFYRYRKGQRFTPHMDHWYRPTPDQITLHTVLIYFNNDFEGGETRFTEQLEELVVPKPGSAAIFQHKIRHEGCPVTRGTKYAMRTDVIFKAEEDIGKVSL